MGSSSQALRAPGAAPRPPSVVGARRLSNSGSRRHQPDSAMVSIERRMLGVSWSASQSIGCGYTDPDPLPIAIVKNGPVVASCRRSSIPRCLAINPQAATRAEWDDPSPIRVASRCRPRSTSTRYSSTNRLCLGVRLVWVMLSQPTQSFNRRRKPVESTAAAQRTVNSTRVDAWRAGIWRLPVTEGGGITSGAPVARHLGARNCLAAAHYATGIRSSNAPSAVAIASRLVRAAGSSNPCATNPPISVSLTSKGTIRMPSRRR